MAVGDRIVLGEGYAVGQGFLTPSGPFWTMVGLSGSRESITCVPLDCDGLEPQVTAGPGAPSVRPDRRRKYRLVLEVLEEAVARRNSGS